MKLRPLTEAEVTFTIKAEQDDLPIKGNAMASGDEKTDKTVEDWVIMQLAQGNIWAWAHVVVTAQWGPASGNASLGACSYESEEDFKQPGGYYEDLKKEALDTLNAELQRMADTIAPLVIPVHICLWSSQPDILIACDHSWTTPKWGTSDTGMPEVYWSNDGRLYTFEDWRTTCEACRETLADPEKRKKAGTP